MVEPLESRVFMSVAPGVVPWARPRLGVPVVVAPPPTDGGAEPAPGPTPPTGGGPGVRRSPLGGNLNFQGDRVQDLPFTDLVKTTRGFYNLAGRAADNGKTALAATDADGWPAEDFAFAAADNSEWGEAVAAGTYRMSFAGPAGTTVAARRDGPAAAGTVPDATPLPTLTKAGYDPATGVHTYDVVVPQGVIVLAFEFRNTGGAVRDVRVLQPGYGLGGYPTFRDEYVNLLRDLAPHTVRLMDWTHTNNNTVANWADRTKPTDATQTKVAAAGDLQPDKGIAWEYGIQLANTVGSNIWVCVPAHATDDYVRQLATLLKDTLRADLKVYVEYSNEVWNTGFEQGRYNLARAKAEVAAGKSNLDYDGSTDPGTWADRLYARRTKEIADAFEGVWTSAGQPNPINDRVRVILSSQVAVLSRFDTMLKYVDTMYGAPKNYFYGIGISPGINMGSLQNREGLTKDQVLTAFSKAVDNYQNNTVLSTAKSKASAWGLRMESYGGGIDTYGAASAAAKRAAMLDPRVKDIMARYLDVWYAKGGGLFSWETIGARSFNSPYGTWSITEDIRDFNQPKEVAFRQVRDAGLGG